MQDKLHLYKFMNHFLFGDEMRGTIKKLHQSVKVV